MCSLCWIGQYETHRKLNGKSLNDVAFIEETLGNVTIDSYYMFKVHHDGIEYEAMIDIDDKHLLNKYAWTVAKQGDKLIIKTNVGGKKFFSMTKLIMNDVNIQRTVCIDGNFTNMRKSNLRNVLKKPKCSKANCKSKKKANYGIPNSNRRYCFDHKTTGMVNLIHKLCERKGCPKRASFGFENEIRKYCSKHQEDGMINVTVKHCEIEGCYTIPVFGPKLGVAVRCDEHKTKTMINLKNKMCEAEGCDIDSTFGLEWQRPTHCVTHKTKEMVNVKDKKCENCTTTACFGLEWQKPTHCATHKTERMVNVRDKRCEYDGCIKSPSFGLKWKYATHCADHKTIDMVDVLNEPCEYPDCPILPSFGLEWNRPIYCVAHKTKEMANVVSKKCKTPLCGIKVSNESYEGYCLRCFVYMFPDKPAFRNYKTKERTVVEFILSEFPKCEWVEDKKIHGGFSACRPDLLLELKHQVIIIEIDENQHTAYNCYCDNNRTVALAKDVGEKPVVFIRFNPDGYTNADGIKMKSCWKSGVRAVCSVPKENKKEWEARLNSLSEEISYWIDKKNKTSKLIEVVQLYYDGMI